MILPFIPIKKQILLPYDSDQIRVGKPNSVLAMNLSIENKSQYKNKIVIAFIKDAFANEPEITNKDMLEDYGVVASIKSPLENNGVYALKLNCASVVKITDLIRLEETNQNSPLVLMEYEPIINTKNLVSIEDLNKSLKKLDDFIAKKPAPKGEDKFFSPNTFDFAVAETLRKFIKNEIINEEIKEYKEPQLNEQIWTIIKIIKSHLTREDLLKLLPLKNDALINEIVSRLSWKFEAINVDFELSKKMNEEMENSQRDFLVREKIKQLRSMLSDEASNDAENIEKDPEESKRFPTYVLEALKAEQARLASMMASSPEANVTKTYIDLILALPWRKVSKELIDINHVRKVLDKHHSGLEKPKQRILEFISVLTHTKSKNANEEYLAIKNDSEHFVDKNLFVHKTGDTLNNPVNNIPILTLIGPPGTGKTTLAKSIAEALQRKFIKVSLGGVKDESEIRGHRRTYVGAMPGKIISAIKKAGVSNPVILLDEIDKMSSDFRGDPTSAMLEVLDPEQNANFQDHYLDLEYDLSKVLFIATANYYDSIPAALIDRVELLELSTYTTSEKIEIAKTHLMPKVLEQNALNESQMQISDEAFKFLIHAYTRESGVRELKRLLDSIARKIVVKILDKEVADQFVVDEKVIIDFLGPIKFEEDENENKDQIGVVNGLAYTSFGGSTLAIEVTTFPGKEGLKLTGHLKDVMKESAQIALAYVRANAEKFGIDFDFENKSIHIHVPAGAIPKDGPSAGVTFTTSIISALSKKPVPANVGMTGEITLRGKVLPIGGLKEKSLAAAQFGIKKIFIPYDNAKNLIDVPDEVKKEVEFIPVKYYEEIFDVLFK
ncbi:Heat shock ATP-dependent protease La [Metamycoplasma auris 15026]|uniref:Lon protease n=1 Tax=Metamycoplasma auris 15026 TaxID=1188233 RepID=N9VD66_9BACT|nr:endopeptidase La [Metamycoplasma auris]ENY69356.1 Heat shock ATP-dependent protease La [Metamycoplasma auris 15026]